MISPFFRIDTGIVVPNNKFRQCFAVVKSKNLLERCQRVTPLDAPRRLEAALLYCGRHSTFLGH
jgi:hypothetical protein